MKINIKLWLVLILTSYCFIGCASVSGVYKPDHSFAENERDSALVVFGKGVSFIDYEGTEYPKGVRRTFQSPMLFPSGIPLNIRVFIYWEGNKPGYRRRGIFNCPPLESGGEYLITFDYKEKGVFVKIPEDGYSIVISKRSDMPGTANKAVYEPVYKQEIPPL